MPSSPSRSYKTQHSGSHSKLHKGPKITDLHLQAEITTMTERINQLRKNAEQRYQGSHLMHLLGTRKTLLEK